MNPSVEFDMWAESLAQKIGIRATRDPDLLIPPCVYVDAPTITRRGLNSTTYEVPVFLIAPGVGKQAGDYLLNNGSEFLSVLEESGGDPRTLTIGDVQYPTLHVRKTITIER